MGELIITSPAFQEGGLIPINYTGYGEDRSPALHLSGIDEKAQTLAILMDDLGHPVSGFNHWVIWNIPVMAIIPENIPQGKIVETLPGAVQGRGWGKHRYRGPKPPFHWSHVYRFTAFALDCRLDLPGNSRKKALLSAMRGHILQQAEITGHYR